MNTTTEPQPDIEWLASHGPSDWPAISFEDAVRALGVEHAIAVWHLTEGSAQRARDELDAFQIAHNGAMTGTQALITQLRSDLQQTQQELQNAVATMATLQQQLGPAVGPGAAPTPGGAHGGAPVGAAVPAAFNPQAVTPKVKFPEPEEFSGDRTKFSAFASQVRAYLVGMGHVYQTDRQRSLYTLQKVRGEAYNHVQAWVDSADTPTEVPELGDWNTCMASLKSIFGPLDEQGDARRALKALRHRTTVDTFAADFRRLGALTGFAENALVAMFEDGLKQEIREHLVGRTKPTTLGGWIQEAGNIERDIAMLKGVSRSNQMRTPTTTATHTSTVAVPERDGHQSRDDPGGED